jgi:hypothetical protein
MSLWQITCVDTMKDSRDTCFPVANQMSAAAIQQGVNLCATLSVTHITVDCYLDYAAYTTAWVGAVRTTGRKIWWRPKWNDWAGDNGGSGTMTPAQYITATQNFIIAHPTLFQSGDILDIVSEPDLGPYWNLTYGAGWTSGAPTAGTNAFNTFLLNCDTQIQTTLQSLGIMGVNTKIRSLSSFWGKNITALYPATVAALGYVTSDSYPEASSTDPAVCAAARLTELQQIAAARPGVPIIIGELGYSNAVNVDDTTQNNVLAAELAAIATVPAVVGVNYWVAQGTSTSGGYTHLFAGNRGAWTLRPAASTLANFYAQQRLGWLDASAQSVSVAGQTVTPEAGSLSIPTAINQRSTARFRVLDPTGTKNFLQGQPVTIMSGGGNGSPNSKLFAGVVMSAKRSSPGWESTMIHDLGCADWHYLADKRIAATSYANQTVGFMVADLIANYLAAEGVTYQRGVNLFSAQQSDVEANDLTPFNAGTSVTISQDTTQSPPHGTGALKFVSAGGANTFEQIEVRVPANLFTAAQVVTISMWAKASTGTPTVRFYCQADTGAIGTATSIVLSTTWTRYTKTVTLPNPIVQIYFGLRMDTGSPAQAITVYMDQMQFEVAAAATAWELGGLKRSVDPGPVVSPGFLVTYVPVSKAFDDLAQLSSMTWQIDQNKVVWFTLPSATIAPWVYDGTQADDTGSAISTVEETNPLYRNSQWILSIKDVTSSQVETRQGDGKNQAFSMSYPLHSTPTITVNAVSKTVGIGQVDTGKDWYWNQGNNVVFQDPAGVKLISTDTLSVTYVGEWTSNAYSQDAGAVATELAIEGGGTGIVEEAHSDASITTTAQGFQLAGALLARYARIGRRLSFRTRSSGLAPQQLLTVILPPAWGMANVQALIESVTVSEDNYWWVYDVTALIGPVSDTWVQYFQRIANPLGTLPGNAGSQQTVALLQSETGAWNWAAAYTATVTACPVFPWTWPVTFC